MIRPLLKLLLAGVNAISALTGMQCFECHKKLRLRLVKKDGAFSVECSCCWNHSQGAD